ncbi:sugar ABC superfamily ATP binding cassette transporter, permease protein [Bifidobacterium tsurumiense]|uniref:Sugar ABC superfamily ATP binding cassette transporter, permease protein n=1 Tax=Bifidobacterium tsurumiense TaxID=356829 RepID=A0A087ECT9_9BIFI|nr:sugar ABC transporter permease [Bifidobacterium tsurumiense]KFJ05590.1 sugar ABC superfamily ATP binding cassette transporter, permease protein [Bifidobacterium tsurumiense]
MSSGTIAPNGSADIPFNTYRRDWRKGLTIVAFSAIPVALLVLFTYLPFGSMVGYSFYRMKYIGTPKWVGWENYIQVFTRPDTLSSLKLSVYYMIGALIQVALALYLSTILAFKVRGGNVFKGIYFFPYLINGIAVGFIFKFFYTRGFVFDTVLQWCGFDLNNLPYWLKDQSINNWSLVGASIWRYLGQNVILFIGAMMSIDQSMYEAAEIDGANKWQQFRHIILPASNHSGAQYHSFHYRLAFGIRRPIRHHNRCQRHSNILRAYGSPGSCQSEGRSGIRDGRGIADHHLDMRALAAGLLQIRVQKCR